MSVEALEAGIMQEKNELQNHNILVVSWLFNENMAFYSSGFNKSFLWTYSKLYNLQITFICILLCYPYSFTEIDLALK